MRHVPALLFAASLLFSCSTETRQQHSPARVADIAALMCDYGSFEPAVRDSLVDAMRPELTAFMRTVSSDSLSGDLLSTWAASAAVEMFTPPTDSVFPSLEPVEVALGNILGEAGDIGLKLPHRRYAAVVYGRPESILFVDSVMLIALNHYLGADFEGYSHWPVYRRLGKTPERLPYDMAEALIATEYPFDATGEECTLLSAMLYQGALLTAVEAVVPDASAGLLLGYDDTRMRWLADHEAEVWNTIVSRQLLYDTSEATVDRFIAPAPALRTEGYEWPARTGRYIGYSIVQAYRKAHPEVPIASLLSPEFYKSQSSLIEADYNPQH
ncbi:MAG: hypothetical protein NC418_05270 [Muribaculaceae bacterium]|nr:hypothetical protein [Muribaculaceae bacterium]